MTRTRPHRRHNLLQALRPPRSADDVGTAIAHLALARALAQSAARR